MKFNYRVLALAALFFFGSLWAFDFKRIMNPNKNRKFSTHTPTAVAGVRGLDEPGSEGDLDARNDEAVAWLESQTVSDQQVMVFLSEGRLEPLP